jgi:DNA-binding transcriptional MerR regulator
MDEYTVGEAARLSHVSVRTLHHYDEIGLLVPGGRSAAGYRLYSAADLQRLQQILLYRELDFPLGEIAQVLAGDGSGPDATAHLRRQHGLLRARQARTATLLSAIERELEARKMGIALTPQEQFEIFGTSKLEEHQAEAEQKWGDTGAWQQSRRKTAAYTKDDWIMIKAEADAGSTTARTTSTAAWPSCTSPIPAIWPATTRSRPVSRSTCTTRFWPMLPGIPDSSWTRRQAGPSRSHLLPETSRNTTTWP